MNLAKALQRLRQAGLHGVPPVAVQGAHPRDRGVPHAFASWPTFSGPPRRSRCPAGMSSRTRNIARAALGKWTTSRKTRVMRALWVLGAQRWGGHDAFRAELAKFRAPFRVATLQCFLRDSPELERALGSEIAWKGWLQRQKKTSSDEDGAREATEAQVYRALEVDLAFFQCTRTPGCVDPLREKRAKYRRILRIRGQAAANEYLRTTPRAHRGACRRCLKPGDCVRAPFIYGPGDWKVETGTVTSIVTSEGTARARARYAGRQTAELDLDGWWSLA